MGTRYSSFPVSCSLTLLEPAFSLLWKRTCLLHLQLQFQKSQCLWEKFYRFSDYLGTTSQMSELLGISSISGILRFGRYPAYHGISEPHLAVKSSKSVVENRPYY